MIILGGKKKKEFGVSLLYTKHFPGEGHVTRHLYIMSFCSNQTGMYIWKLCISSCIIFLVYYPWVSHSHSGCFLQHCCVYWLISGCWQKPQFTWREFEVSIVLVLWKVRGKCSLLQRLWKKIFHKLSGLLLLLFFPFQGVCFPVLCLLLAGLVVFITDYQLVYL